MASLKDLALKIIIGAEDKSGPSLSSARQNVDNLSHSVTQVTAQIVNFAKAYFSLSAIKAGFGLVDTYNELQAKIKQVVGDSAQLAVTQDRLFKIAQATASPIKDTIDLYSRTAEALKKVADGQELAAKLTETVNYSFKAQNTNTAEMSSTVSQLTQAIGTGTVTWEDFGNVAQSNLLLANTAAQNLGYDGISGLKQAISESKITGEQMARAIVAGFDDIKARADQMPVGVSRSMVLINNALIKFAGESNTANSAARTFSETLQFIAGNITAVANVVLILAEAYGARLVLGLLESAEAYAKNKEAAEELAAATEAAGEAAQESLRLELQLALIRVAANKTLAEEARLQVALASTEEERVQAQTALAQAMRNYRAAVEAAAEAQAALNTDTDDAGETVGRFSGVLAKLRGLVEKVFIIKIAIDAVGGALDTLGEYNEKIRIFSFAWKATMEELQVTAKHFLSGDFLTSGSEGLREKYAAIQQKYSDLAVASTDSAQAIAAAEEEKAKASEEAAQKQAAAFKQVQDATQKLTAQLDADAKLQTQAIQQALAERLVAIEAADQLDGQKDTARLQAKLQAAQQELTLQQAVSTAKLKLIDAEYAGELEKAQGNADRLKDIETSKRQAKLAVYQGVAEFYTAEVNRLSEVYAQELQAAAQARQSIERLSTTHQQRLLDIERLGMTERQKAASEELEFTKTVSALRAELAKGDAASQTTINELMSRAKTLQDDITQAAINSAETQSKKSSAVYEAKKRENQINALQLDILEVNAKAYEENAKKELAALESNKQKLAEIKDLITGITEQLAKDYTLTIGIDQGSLATAQSAIADLVKPETKVITIETVNAGSGADAVPAQATGGPAGQPTGKPWRFASGGWARMAGLLSGYGGGDKRRALLEDGEYVVRKEAVKKLGVDTLNAVNQGELPLQRSTGGSIGDILQEELKKQNLEKIKKLFNDAPAEAINRFFGWGYFDDSIDMRGITKGNALSASGVTREKLENKLRPLLAGMDAQVREQVNRLMQNLPNLYMLRGGLGMTSNAFADHPLDASIRDTVNKESLVFNALLKDLGNTDAKTNKPTFSLPAIPSLPSAQAQAATMAAPSKTVTVQFKAPDGSGGVSAAFNSEADVSKMLDMIKQTGMRVGA